MFGINKVSTINIVSLLEQPLSSVTVTIQVPAKTFKLGEVFPEESKIERSQKTTSHYKYDRRLENTLSGQHYALSDYRVFLASQVNQHPYTDQASESTIGNPLEHFKFDNRFYSRSFLNYLTGINYLKRVCSPTNIGIVLEIGGGYGTLGEILLGD